MDHFDGGKRILLTSEESGLKHLLKIYFPDYELLSPLNRGLIADLEYVFSVCGRICNIKSCLKKARFALIYPEAVYVICRPILASEDGKSKYGYWLSYMRNSPGKNMASHLMNPSMPCIHRNYDVLEMKKEIVKTRGRLASWRTANPLLRGSVYNLSKKMKSLTGNTMKAFQKRIMLCHALHDLFLSSASIKEIAFNLNMQPNAFRTTFKCHFGMSPTKIRK